ncbi:2'-5' RNA ligase family protein [Chitinophaga rhizophila]|uniref:2'-5' RNA ligase family protein n=1 Tax=Chitinophaga rhizophila TaxID=2866212 RepID=A0ABS7GAY7_9BACT|nr:2'-5' RNA ligase family protein [Chitinophaga rhizophila]MBW8684836.1 2'-5' RNA ligase family protein [Chitinophaga rhizophila]
MQTNNNIAFEQETLYDYLLVVSPGTHITNDVTALKQLVARELGMYGSRLSQANISLFRSVFPERFQEEFINMLENIARKQSGFTLYTSKFDHFQHGEDKRTIYVNVANPKPLVELHKRILHEFDIKPGTFKPHITVARAIATSEFDRVYDHFHNQVFVRSFQCKSFMLLRKPASGGQYELVKEFLFGDEAVQQDINLFNYAA